MICGHPESEVATVKRGPGRTRTYCKACRRERDRASGDVTPLGRKRMAPDPVVWAELANKSWT
jgi:hypothetical protein